MEVTEKYHKDHPDIAVNLLTLLELLDSVKEGIGKVRSTI